MGDGWQADGARTLRVLLISPVRGVDPLSGDVTYTEQLLAAAPPGVQYTLYTDALRSGDLIEHGTRAAVSSSRGAARCGEFAIAAWRKFESVVRASGLVFRERLRHFSVRPGAFDAVQVHVFHHRFFGTVPPVIASAAGPLAWPYAEAWGWSTARIAVAESFDRWVGAVWDATMCARRRGRATRLVVFSDYLRRWLTAQDIPADCVEVVPNYLDARATTASARTPRRLGFVAKDFSAKGGHILLDAFDLLRRRHDGLELLVVGSPPQLDEDECARRGIRWLPFVERSELLLTVLPSIDILVYPSLFDGLPYGPMEALAAGIPLVVSDYRALPELIGDAAGRISATGDPASVAAAVEPLLDEQTWIGASRAASAHFARRFSAATQAPRLRRVYDAALGHEQQRVETGAA